MNIPLNTIGNDNQPFRLIRLTKRWRQVVEQKVQLSGLTDATWRPLLHLLLLGNGIRQKDLADSIGITGPSLVRLLDTLINNQLIVRNEDADDRRAKKLYLTTAGETLARQIQESVQEIDELLLQGFSAEELKQMLDFTSRLENNLDTIIRQAGE